MYNINPFNPFQGVNPAYLPPNSPVNMHGASFNQIIKVNGRGGAEAYQMPANSQVLLLDETQPVLWLKQTDGAGYPSLTAYDITPHEDKAAPDMQKLEERITKIEEVINNESYFANNSRKITDDGAGKTSNSLNKKLWQSDGDG